MRHRLQTFTTADDGQDLIEYTLLLAFLALGSAIILFNFHGSMAQVTSLTNSNLSAAESVAVAGSGS
jgi:Flp pilus assembly pilin Flp